MPVRKLRAKRSVNTRGGGADAGNVGKLRDVTAKVKKIMGRQARPKIPKDLLDKFRKTGPKKRKPMTPLKRKS
jgi:hypothetical protein